MIMMMMLAAADDDDDDDDDDDATRCRPRMFAANQVSCDRR